MLKQVQHDHRVFLLSFVIPNLIRDLGFGLENLGFKRGALAQAKIEEIKATGADMVITACQQ